MCAKASKQVHQFKAFCSKTKFGGLFLHKSDNFTIHHLD
ncbi:hypothetical protein MC7420_3398 [Coleofasciculus chthonoplastes PCC 7420]|uniref:Uncharacterized protein n=1 Tax=Coleofasciculus chthonoplastes PCC 7420 TaxID=118168 RepID=B4W3E7_9CYAN|nr:hypothetical protein MC7420_3398 [Coleofasciculus chthonoplastes PCC 7420]